MQPYEAISIFIILLLSWLHSTLAQNFVPIQSLTGKIGGGNYTYYKLLRSGNVRIILNAAPGDADIYVSQTVLHPTYEVNDLQSWSCGEDIVDIPDSFKRPVGIGIYGHPRHLESTYECQILVENSDGSLPYMQETPWGHHSNYNEEEEEPLLWTIFVNILKVIIDILV